MNRDELLARYRDGYRAVVDALRGVDLDVRPAPNEWTPREIVHHVLDSEIARAFRLRRLLTEEQPHIEGFDQDAWASVHADRPLEPSLRAFEALVDANVALFERLSDEELDRPATHAEFGAFAPRNLLERAAAHGHEHAEQIKRCAS